MSINGPPGIYVHHFSSSACICVSKFVQHTYCAGTPKGLYSYYNVTFTVIVLVVTVALYLI